MTKEIKILIVEDSSLVRFKIKKAFEQFAIKYFELNNAEDLFRFSKKFQQMDLIILDINLPDMDGITALERMYSDIEWQSIPVIMLTGKADRKTVERAFKAGTINYIRKPFTDDDLLVRIEQILGPLPYSPENSDICPEEELYKKIHKEVERARLGNYKLSLLEVDALSSGKDCNLLEDLMKLGDEISAQLRDIDDMLITEDYTLLLILPFMDEKEVVTLSDKLSSLLSENYDKKIKQYFVTFPNDGQDSKELFNNLKKDKEL